MARIYGPPLTPWIEYFDNKENAPDAKTVLALEAIFAAAEVKSFSNVHRITGKLQASHTARTDVRRSKWMGRWTGDISVGRGVDYAEYERDRVGIRPDWVSHPSHKWIEGLDVEFYPQIDAIIDALT